MALLHLPRDRRDWLLTIGVTAVAAGFVMVALAWNGAAGKDTIQEQFPYVLSGGLGGLGLLAVGAAVIVLQSFRRDHDRVSSEIAELRETIARTLTATVASAADQTVQREPIEFAALQPDDEDGVIPGRSSYHRLDCRLARGRSDERIPAVEAQALGLQPCRICDP